MGRKEKSSWISHFYDRMWFANDCKWWQSQFKLSKKVSKIEGSPCMIPYLETIIWFPGETINILIFFFLWLEVSWVPVPFFLWNNQVENISRLNLHFFWSLTSEYVKIVLYSEAFGRKNRFFPHFCGRSSNNNSTSINQLVLFNSFEIRNTKVY